MMSKSSKEPKKMVEAKKTENTENENVAKAHEQAEIDIQQDPEISIVPEKGDDLDEGELARLEGE